MAADRLNIVFYSARYHDEYHSIFPMGDISALIPDSEADVCILEEPGMYVPTVTYIDSIVTLTFTFVQNI